VRFANRHSKQALLGWGEIFGDEDVTERMIDRHVHDSEIVPLKCDPTSTRTGTSAAQAPTRPDHGRCEAPGSQARGRGSDRRRHRGGLRSYRAWAGSGWQPPPEPIGSIELIRERLASPQVWAAVAEEGREGRRVVAFRELLKGAPLTILARLSRAVARSQAAPVAA
jgi:hypothetical protein